MCSSDLFRSHDRRCRDDKVIWNEQTNKWNLIMADALEHQVLFYSSDDLTHWTKDGVFGQGFGAQSGVWECPELMQLLPTDLERYLAVAQSLIETILLDSGRMPLLLFIRLHHQLSAKVCLIVQMME